jgi:hypothetical protein
MMWQGVFYWSAGKGPTTERAKRRHALRSTARQQHAKQVWQGGYTPRLTAELTTTPLERITHD